MPHEAQTTTVQKILRSELSFYGAIAAGILGFAGFYFGVTNQLNLIEQKVATHIESTANLPVKIAELSEKLAILWNETHGK